MNTYSAARSWLSHGSLDLGVSEHFRHSARNIFERSGVFFTEACQFSAAAYRNAVYRDLVLLRYAHLPMVIS